jgi:hypothetical protein
MNNNRKPLAVIGLVLLAAGLILGLMSVSQHGVSCGSAFASRDMMSTDFRNELTGVGPTNIAEDCKDATSSRKTIALALVIPGVLLTIGAGLGWAARAGNEQRRQEAAQ